MILKLNGSESSRLKKIKTTARKLQFHLRQFCCLPIVSSVYRIMVKSLKVVPKWETCISILRGSQTQNRTLSFAKRIC